MKNNWTEQLKIKVCGMRDKANISQLVQLPIDYIGFIFFEKSPRFVSNDYDLEIVKNIPPHIKKTGVFVNASEQYIQNQIKTFSLQCIQLHGKETPEFCDKFKEQVDIIKAFGVDDDFDFTKLSGYNQVCDYFLFDTKSKQHGGTGVKFDWSILQQYDNEKPLFLSGGIGAGDVEELKNLAWLNIHALDLNSRFEKEPAMKDIEALRIFLEELK